MKYRLIRVAGLAIALAAGTHQAHAGIMFDFEPLFPLQQDPGISAYMTGVAGFPVTTDRAVAGEIVTLGDDFIRNAAFGGGSFEIAFGTAITSAEFTGIVFDATPGADFEFKAYSGGTGGTLIDSFTFEVPGPGPGPLPVSFVTFESGLRGFSAPVDTLFFSDSGVFDVGISELAVTAVPEPATLASGLMGIALVGGYLRRRRRRDA